MITQPRAHNKADTVALLCLGFVVLLAAHLSCRIGRIFAISTHKGNDAGHSWALADECMWAPFYLPDIKVADIVVDGNIMRGSLPYDRDPGYGAWSPDAKQRRAISYRTEKCVTDSWVAVRIGPFYSTGGELWMETLASFQDELRIPRYLPGIYAFSEFAIGNIDDDNLFLGFPPIHQHHTHVWGKGQWWATDTIGLHGENQCTPDEGGSACYIRKAPAGMAYIINATDIEYWAAQLDVRPLNSPPLKSWQFVAFKVLTQQDIPTRDIQIVREAKIQVHPLPHFSRDTYGVIAGRECVVWTTGSLDDFMDARSTIAEAYWHVHSEFTKDALLFQGSAHEVYHDVKAMSSSFEQLAYGTGVIAETEKQIRIRQYAADAAPLACSFKLGSRTERVGDAVYYRFTQCQLNASLRDYVFIALHVSPRREGLWRMHTMIRVYYTGGLNKSFVWGSSDLTVSEFKSRIMGH